MIGLRRQDAAKCGRKLRRAHGEDQRAAARAQQVGAVPENTLVAVPRGLGDAREQIGI